MAAMLLIVIGLVLLTVGAEFLVKGAACLARRLGLSSLVIGLTLVAYGTSAPEAAVSLKSSFLGMSDIALGNVVGSNIFNILFVLGLSATFAPMQAPHRLVRLDVPVMLATSLALWLFALDGRIGPLEGGGFCLALVGYTAFLLHRGSQPAALQEKQTETFPKGKWWAQPSWMTALGLVLAGLALLIIGARWLVQGALELAQAAGVSDLVVALTIVATGTSLPELATSVIASLRGEREICVGNILGSNIFNILGILGLSSLTDPSGLLISPAALDFDIPVMCGVATLCLPILFTGGQISRREGVLFCSSYLLYVTYLVLRARHSSLLPLFTNLMVWAVLPSTLLILAIQTYRRVGRRKNHPGPR